MKEVCSPHLVKRPSPGSLPARAKDTCPLTATIEPFDSFWEGPEDVAKGYDCFARFYRSNYLQHMPPDKHARILVISCGPGYFVNLLRTAGYEKVSGIDSGADKVAHAIRRGLPCKVARAFDELQQGSSRYDVIICEQELNHLTKQEMVEFLTLVWGNLSNGGRLICHSLNGANPVVGAETLAQNFDHYNTFTEYSLRQVLEHCGFCNVRVFGLHLYVFYYNPLNYVAWGAATALSLICRGLFVLYGKKNKIFTKKIGAVADKGAAS